MQCKNILHKLPRVWLADDLNRSKSSESVTSDSLSCIRAGVNFTYRSQIFRPQACASDSISRWKFLNAMPCAEFLRENSASQAELALQKIVDRLRTGFTAGRFHNLTDKPADRLRIGPGVCDFVGIFRDHIVNDLCNRTQVGHLGHSARGNDGPRIAA